MKSNMSVVFILGAAALLFISFGAAGGTQISKKASAEVAKAKEEKQCGNGCCNWGPRRLCTKYCLANENTTSNAAFVNEEAQSEEPVNDDDREKRKCKFHGCYSSRVSCRRCCAPRQLSEVVVPRANQEAGQYVNVADSKQIENCRYGCCRVKAAHSPQARINCLECCPPPS